MKELFLAGGGDAEDSMLLDRLLVERLPQGGRMVYLPIGMDEERHSDCLESARSVFVPLGFPDIEMWTDVAGRIASELAQFAAVYIGGGNTFRLLDSFREIGFDKLLVRYIDEGGLVYGGSAGAILLGRDIAAAAYADENTVGVTDTLGLNQVGGYPLWCHYEPGQDRLIREYTDRRGHPVIALTERRGIHAVGRDLRVIGPGDAAVFSGNKKAKLAPGSLIENH